MEGPKTWLNKRLEKREAEAIAAKDPEETEETGLTINEILHDNDESRMFGAMLESMADPSLVEVATRMRSGNLEDADIKKVEGLRAEYLDRKDRAEKLDKAIDTGFDALHRESESLQKICSTFGKENYMLVLKQGLGELVMNDPKAFKKIEQQFLKLDSSEKSLNNPENKYNKQIMEFCQKYKITDDQLEPLFSDPSPLKRAENIQEYVRGQMNFFERWLDRRFQGVGNRTLDKDSLTLSQSQPWMEKELDDHMKLIEKSGGVLAALVSKNPEWRKALMSAKPGETPEFKGVSSTMAFSEAKNGTIKTDHLMNAWETYRDRVSRDFSSRPSHVQESIRDQFLKDYGKKNAPGGDGFWASVVQWVFSNKVKNDPKIRTQLK